MTEPEATLRWAVLAESVVGASHTRSGKPNQDAIDCVQRTTGALPLLLAVADGHGGSAYFRSETGARLAVKTALALGEDFLETFSEEEAVNGPSYQRLRDLCGLIVKQWNEEVDLDLSRNPLEDTDPARSNLPVGMDQGLSMDRLEEIDPMRRNRPTGIDTDLDNHSRVDTDLMKKRNRPPLMNARIPYGSTLLLVIVTEQAIIYLQLGDGDIMTVADDGTVQAVPGAVHLLGNETQSLCMPAAWDDFVVRCVPMNDGVPSLIMVSTDGYRNSYPEDASFEKVAQDLAQLLSTDEGEQNVCANLNAWLLETTKMGSGDDITVGLIFRQVASNFKNSPSVSKAGD